MNPDDPRHESINAMEEQLSMLWRRARAIGNKVARQVHPDLEPGAYGLLRTLQRFGDMRLTDLAAEIGVGKPTVSRQITLLERVGVVQKVEHPQDARSQTISLTPAGAEQLANAQAARRRVFHDLLEDWENQDLTELARLLAKLNETYLKDTF